MAKRQLKVGIVGAGVMGKVMAGFFSSHGGYQIAAVCDTNESLARETASRYSAKAFSSFPPMLEGDLIDVLYVVTPPRSHCDIVVAALRAGKHVLCEKPMAMSSEECERMVRATPAGIVTAVNFPMKYDKGIADFRSLLHAGYIGKLRRLELRFRHPQWPRSFHPYSPKDWINRRDQGGILREQGCHFYWALLDIFGVDQVKRIRMDSIDYPANDSGSAEIGALGVIELKSGVQCLVDLLSECSLTEDTQYFTGYGEKGVLSLVEKQFLFASQNGAPLAIYDKDRPYKPEEHKLMDSSFIISNFYNAVVDAPNTPAKWNLVDFKVATQTQRIIDAIFSSNGAWVQIADPLL